MKRLFALMAVVLAVVSCQKDVDNLDVNTGGDVATISVALPADAVTRAADRNSAESGLVNTDGELVRIIFEVYYKGETNPDLRQYAYLNEGELTANFDVRLVPNRDYTFVAWADQVDATTKENNYFNVDDLKNVQILDWKAMDECRDAYTETKLVEDFNSGMGITLTLTRPFAKLRVKTTDMAQLNDLGIMPTKATVTYTTKHYNAFNAFEGKVIADSKNRDIKHELFTIESYDEAVAEDADMTLFTDYFFATSEEEVVNFAFDVYDQNNELIKSNTFNTPIPVKRNNLTTIAGNILTDGNNINVVVNPEFGDEGYEWPSTQAEDLAYAAMFGGEVTLTEDVELKQPLVVKAKMTLNLGGKTINTTLEREGRHHYAILNSGTLTIKGNGAINARGIKNFGTMTVEGDVVITNMDTDGGAAIWNEGDLTINNGTFKTNANAGTGSYGAALNTRAGGKAVVNGGTFEAYSQLTYAVVNEGETVIYNATVKGKHGAVAGAETNDKTTIYGGSFKLMENPGVSDHCTYKVSAIYGGTFSLGNNTDSGAKVFCESNIANGYKAFAADGVYYVLPETIANAAEAAGVTTVTESTADVATALATDNGEATLFMWNDVAYIAKYGEVVIISDADEATTVRGVVEYSTGLTSATVADGIEVVGNRTFRKCANLETVALPNTLTEIGPAVFQSCSKLANITIPESVTTIGEGAFAECTALTSINIPAGITRLEKDVLRNTGLVSIEIPASVNYIGTYAFRDCESLTEVKILSPEFTIENNTFTNMAAPVPTMTIHVVNDEMKAYLESILTNYDKTYITVKGPKSVSNAAELNTAVTEKNATVNVAAGEYTFPSSVADGVTIQCEEGTVFTGTSSVSGNGAKIIGATFRSNFNSDDDRCLTGNLNNTTFENCVFEAYSSARYCYAYGDIVFNNCKFGTPESWRGIHFDAGNGTVTFNNCDLYGFQAFGKALTKVTFNECNFYKGRSTNVVNMYNVFEYNNCEFVADYHCDCADNGVVAAFNNCSYADNSDITKIVRFDKDKATCTITFNGDTFVAEGLVQNNGTYRVLNAAGLNYFSNKSVADGTVIELIADIDFNGAEFKAIAAGYDKSLTFKGNNHTIKNVKIATCSHNSVGAASLFFCYPGGTINVSDLVVEKATSEGATYAGTILGYTQGNATLKNITVKDSEISGVKKIGGLVGFVEASTSSFIAENCHIVNTKVVATEKQAGTILGYNAKPATLKGCTVDALSTATAPAYCDGGVRCTDPAQAALTIE